MGFLPPWEVHHLVLFHVRRLGLRPGRGRISAHLQLGHPEKEILKEEVTTILLKLFCKIEKNTSKCFIQNYTKAADLQKRNGAHN